MKYLFFLAAAMLLAVTLVMPGLHNAVRAEPAATPIQPASDRVYLPMVRGLGQAPAANPTLTATPAFTAAPLNTPTPTMAATATPTETATPTPTETPAPAPSATAVPVHSDWAIDGIQYRVLAEIDMNGTERSEKPAEFAIDFTTLLASAGEDGAFDPYSLRVVEVDGKNNVLNYNVPFQFDPDASYNARSNAGGTMVVMLEGSSKSRSGRRYHVYFDILRGLPAAPANVAPRVTLVDGVVDEGQASYEIRTDSATYFYHKEGGGFSSLIDAAGNDWIGYTKAAGAAGEFRGIPNMVHREDGGYFHPGRGGVISSALSQGPLKAAIHSATPDGKWQTLWEIYPDYARLTVLKADANYWVLYEGAPGGLLEVETDFVVLADKTKMPLKKTWQGDLAAPEWLYFGDPLVDRSLYFVHHENDDVIDSYYAMDEAMTVFGFGRDGAKRRLSEFPARFTLGFADKTDFSTVESALNNAYQPLTISVGTTERQGA